MVSLVCLVSSFFGLFRVSDLIFSFELLVSLCFVIWVGRPVHVTANQQVLLESTLRARDPEPFLWSDTPAKAARRRKRRNDR